MTDTANTAGVQEETCLVCKRRGPLFFYCATCRQGNSAREDSERRAAAQRQGVPVAAAPVLPVPLPVVPAPLPVVPAPLPVVPAPAPPPAPRRVILRRTYHREGWEEVGSRHWGKRFLPLRQELTDPDPATVADADAPNERKFELAPDFPKLPWQQWRAVIDLYFHFLNPPGGPEHAPDSVSEVSVIFARLAPDFREWRTFVPKQTVGATSVNADLTELVDILTGEVIKGGVPGLWNHVGSSHSHNRMGAFFSSTDNQNELGVSGLHIVVGQMHTWREWVAGEGAVGPEHRRYEPLASIVQKGIRYEGNSGGVPFLGVVEEMPADATPATFHPTVLDYVSKHSYGVVTCGPGRTYEDTGYFGFAGGIIHSSSPSGRSHQSYEEMDREYDMQAWLNSPSGSRKEDFRRDKRKADSTIKDGKVVILRGKQEVVPVALRAGLMAARHAAQARLPKHFADKVRQLCNAVEECYLHPDARDIAREIGCDLALDDADARDAKLWDGLDTRVTDGGGEG